MCAPFSMGLSSFGASGLHTQTEISSSAGLGFLLETLGSVLGKIQYNTITQDHLLLSLNNVGLRRQG